MISLYDQNPKAWDILAASGKPSIAEMARHFSKCSEMERAMGYSSTGAVSHWLSGNNGASRKSEAMARAWLDGVTKQQRPKAKPQAQTAGNLLLVAGAPEKLEKARKILELIGCEVEDI